DRGHAGRHAGRRRRGERDHHHLRRRIPPMIADPVSGFVYPPSWIERCGDPLLLDAVAEGLAVLTADGAVRRRGFTTGTTAAAACKAAVRSLREPVDEVGICLPCGLSIRVPVEGRGGTGRC